jgi:AcrB/AcrD/AcrF family
MVDRIIEFSLRNRAVVLLATLALVAAGAWSATRLPIDAVPDITNVQVQINTQVAALSPEEIERQVSFPIETEMAGLQGLHEVRSLSKFGLSQITLVNPNSGRSRPASARFIFTLWSMLLMPQTSRRRATNNSSNFGRCRIGSLNLPCAAFLGSRMLKRAVVTKSKSSFIPIPKSSPMPD